MKKALIIGCLSLFVYSLCTAALSNRTSNNEHPTKEEWLEVYITHRIKHWTDPWRQRLAVTVGIVPKVQVIAITLTSANGQEEIPQSKKNNYVRDVEGIVRNILEEYDWAKNYKLTVQYI